MWSLNHRLIVSSETRGCGLNALGCGTCLAVWPRTKWWCAVSYTHIFRRIESKKTRKRVCVEDWITLVSGIRIACGNMLPARKSQHPTPKISNDLTPGNRNYTFIPKDQEFILIGGTVPRWSSNFYLFTCFLFDSEGAEWIIFASTLHQSEFTSKYIHL